MPYHMNTMHQSLRFSNLNTITESLNNGLTQPGSGTGSGLDATLRNLLDFNILDKDAAWLSYATSPLAGENGDYQCYAERKLHRVDIQWLLISSMRVLSMQVAFGLFEAGCTRPCHVATVVLKNVGDMLIGAIAYWLVGYGISYGNSDDGVEKGVQNDISTWTFSSSPSRIFFADIKADNAVWIFQMSFACTATTIVSGMIAERGTLRAYLILAFIITGIIYPIIAHWVWGGGLIASMSGGQFTDFAGSAVVHSVGAFAGLAYCFAIGPRIGRFENVNIYAEARQSTLTISNSNLSKSGSGLPVLKSGKSHDELAALSSTNMDKSLLELQSNSSVNSPDSGATSNNGDLKSNKRDVTISTNVKLISQSFGVMRNISRKYSIFHYTPTEVNTHDGHDCMTLIGNNLRRTLRKCQSYLGLKKSEQGVSVRGMLLSKKTLELSRCMLKQRALDTAQVKRGLIYTNGKNYNNDIGSGSCTKNVDSKIEGLGSDQVPTVTPTATISNKNNTDPPSSQSEVEIMNDQSNTTNSKPPIPIKKSDSKQNLNNTVTSEVNQVTAVSNSNFNSLNNDNNRLAIQDRLKRGPIEVTELDRIIRGDHHPNPANNCTSRLNVHDRAAVIWGAKTSKGPAGGPPGANNNDIKSGTLKFSGTHHVKGQEVISNSEDMQMDSVVKGINSSAKNHVKKGSNSTVIDNNITNAKSKTVNPMMPLTVAQQAAVSAAAAATVKKSGSAASALAAAAKSKDRNSNNNSYSSDSGPGSDQENFNQMMVEDEKSLTYNDQYGAELQIKRMLLRAGCFLDQRSGLPSIILFEKSKASSPVNMLFGTMLLLIGWFGFSCGSTISLLNDQDMVAVRVGVNTMFAAIGGGSVPYFWYVLLLDDERPALVQSVCMGILSGLVSSCAGAHLYSRWAAFIIGAIGWCWGEFADRLLRNKFYIDDVVGGFAVHGASGIWGTIAVGIFANPDCNFNGAEWKPTGLLYGGDIGFLGWQIVGISLIAIWAFTSTYTCLYLVDNFLVEIREDVISELLGSTDAPRMVAFLEVLCWGQLRELKMLRNDRLNSLNDNINADPTTVATKNSLDSDESDHNLNLAERAFVPRLQNKIMKRVSKTPIIGKYLVGSTDAASKDINKRLSTPSNSGKSNDSKLDKRRADMKGPSDLLRLIEKSKLKLSQLNIEEQCVLMRALNIRVQWSSGGIGVVEAKSKSNIGAGDDNGVNVGGDNVSNSLGAGTNSNYDRMMEVSMSNINQNQNANLNNYQENNSSHHSNINRQLIRLSNKITNRNSNHPSGAEVTTGSGPEAVTPTSDYLTLTVNHTIPASYNNKFKRAASLSILNTGSRESGNVTSGSEI